MNNHPSSTSSSSSTVLLPIVYYDGGNYRNVGQIDVTPSLNLSILRTTLSRRLDIPPDQLDLSLKEGNEPRCTLKTIDETMDISAAVRAARGHCHVFAMRRSGFLDAGQVPDQRMSVWDYERMLEAMAGPTTNAPVPTTTTNAWTARCAECEWPRLEEKSPESHHCVNDEVKLGFDLKPAAGPIERPKPVTGKKEPK